MKPSNAVVYVVDDDVSVREALASLIGSVSLNVECFASPQEFLRRHSRDGPSCLVLDVRMPGLSGLDLQRELVRTAQPIPIIFISGHGDIPMAVGAMKAGAIEFLAKPFRDEDLLDAIRQALERDQAARGRRAELARIRGRYAQLTARQRQIAKKIVEGRLNKQIAAELHLSENTIKVHRRRIMERMGAANVATLVHLMEQLT
ncbi:MAG TPA: response regulator [Steroidobacteraceae bacterium]|nr:response regulator [Steroidobacteraceae bacterium]